MHESPDMATGSDITPRDIDIESDDDDVIVCGVCYKSFRTVQDFQLHRSEPQPCLRQRTCTKCYTGMKYLHLY